MAETFKLNIGSAELAVECSGEGKPLIFLHAGVADKRMWHYQMAGLNDSYQVVAYDRRGFGETTTADQAFSHIEDLRKVLDKLEVSNTFLVGCSQGGRIAIDFTLAYPQRVTKLVLISTAISGAPAPETFAPNIQARINTLKEAEETNDLARVNAIEANLWLDGATSQKGRVNSALRELFLDMNGIALGMPELTQEIEPNNAYERLSVLSLPVLVIWGELDFPHIKQRCQYIVDTIPNAWGEEIPGTAHLPNFEKPEKINKLLRDFLG
ncbi:putative hydrolase or acyltransferase of alpha/beta superfamily [Rivularia sp. PCC 7116]|uniref:alpha/beta fold hydrolase n=1 Tax=Rivularia sp. PCC 7116 TaxID=373994 RepID=UPI00029F17C7|nr:alpha/beta hydrolase [Rivularia sp. PCC 7116]AFY53842.1 putative hydrolase or acyltransferase of alpha/beta superfamily [Rivularia sp. PCC 7116]